MQKLYIFFLILLLSSTLLFSYETTKSKDELISAYIYLLSKNTSWPNEKKITTFKITIVEKDLELYDTFKKMSKDLYLKKKNIEIIHADSIESINYKTTQVIFLGHNFKSDIKDTYDNIDSNYILLISEECKDLKYTMINFYKDKKYRLNIEINLNNIQTHGLDVNNKILLSGASTVGVGKLYHSSIEAMKKQEEEFKKYQKLNIKLKNELKQYESKIKILNQNIDNKISKYNKTIKDIAQKEFIIKEKEKLLQEKEAKINLKESKIIKLQQNLKQLKKELSKQKNKLNKKIQNIKEQKETLKKYSSILDNKLLEIKKLDKTIKSQEEAIKLNKNIRSKQKDKLEQQQTSLYLMWVITVLLFLFVIYFIKTN